MKLIKGAGQLYRTLLMLQGGIELQNPILWSIQKPRRHENDDLFTLNPGFDPSKRANNL